MVHPDFWGAVIGIGSILSLYLLFKFSDQLSDGNVKGETNETPISNRIPHYHTHDYVCDCGCGRTGLYMVGGRAKCVPSGWFLIIALGVLATFRGKMKT